MPDGPFITEAKDRMPAIANASGNFKSKCDEVSNFLKTSPQRFEAIKELNKQMKVEVMARQYGNRILADPNSKARLLSTLKRENDDMKFFTTHIFSNVLRKMESKNGFTLFESYDKIRKPVTLGGLIMPNEFRRLIEEGKQWKDAGVPVEHGESSHRIQWFMIMNQLNPPIDGWVEFYKKIGQYEHRQKPPRPKRAEKMAWGSGKPIPWKNLGLWDALADRNPTTGTFAAGPYNTTEDNDFRSPENLHRYLTDAANAANFELLNAFLIGRKKKRAEQRAEKKGPFSEEDQHIADYLSKQFYGKIFKELTMKGKITIFRNMKMKIIAPLKFRQIQEEAKGTASGEDFAEFEIARLIGAIPGI